MTAGASHVEHLLRAARDDDAALAAVVRAYHDRALRVGRRACRDAADADDAVQEAFTRLARRPELLRAPSLLGWLLTVVRHACLRLLRPFAREGRAFGQRVDATEEIADSALDAETALARHELVHAVHVALRDLAPQHREVIVLRDLEGLSGEATAALLELELGTMKMRLHRARAELRAKLRANPDLRDIERRA